MRADPLSPPRHHQRPFTMERPDVRKQSGWRQASKQRGWIPVGGAEERENAPEILKRFVQLATGAGGGQADIVVTPPLTRTLAPSET